MTIAAEAPRSRRPGQGKKVARSIVRFLFIAAITFLGLIAVTFFIGRVVPIDPVLAIVGDRATQSTYEATRKAYGLDLPLWQQFLSMFRKP
jgi:peptide/nickel transport system permease protein